jgi:D-aspartate ligase
VEANDDVILTMLDKERTYEAARAAGVPAPKTATVRCEEELDPALEQIGFPCALKPLHSHLFARHFGGRKLVVVHSREEAHRAYAPIGALGLAVLVTEIVPGPDNLLCSCYTYIDERGEPLFMFTKRKIRQYPVGFGLGCYEVTDWSPDVAEMGLRFVRGIGLRGLANVEFKRDPRDGRLVIIECNHRFTAANELVRRAGIDLARLAYGRLTGQAVAIPATYGRNLTLWNPTRDLRSFVMMRRRGLITFRQWARSLLRRQVLPVARLSDPMPTIAYHLGQVVRIPAKRQVRTKLPR